jgi:acetate CoA/acetoacetate CoA-transferase alpha subunit
MVKNGDSVMFGGFLGCGGPLTLVDALIDNDIKDISLIANDCTFPEVGIGKLVVQKHVKKIIVSYVGTNPAVAAQMNEGTLDVDLVPQGTLAERIRSSGAGLGGFLTPTDVGTPVQEGKELMTIDGRKYLLEMPLKADVALVKAWKADEMGNLIFRRSARNHNPLMATAAKTRYRRSRGNRACGRA